MRLHERTLAVQKASTEINIKIWELAEQHRLTDIEILQILTSAQATTLKYMLRAERLPDNTDAGADEATERVVVEEDE